MPILEFGRILIRIDKELLLWREIDSQNGNNNNNNNNNVNFGHTPYASQGFQFHRKAARKTFAKRNEKRRNNNTSGSTQTYKANAFEITLMQSVNFPHSFKLLEKTRTMNNSLLKMVVDEIGNEKQIFEELMMYQDDRFDFKGLSPLMFCIQKNLVDTVYYLLSICEKFGLIEKVCSLILEKVSTDGGNTCKFLKDL